MKNLDISNVAGDKSKRTIGLELENPLIRLSGEPIDFNTVQKLWNSFKNNGWTPRIDPVLANVVDGMTKNFHGICASIMSDSGAGNFELAITPQRDLKETEKIYKSIFSEINKIVRKDKLRLAGLAIQPGRIKNYDNFRRRNAMYSAWNNMKSSDRYANITSSVISAQQVGIGIELKEFVEVVNELTKITGLISALTGNSPIQNWKVLPYKEWRIICMSHLRFVGDIKGFDKLIGFPDRPFSSISDFFKYYWNSPSMMLPLMRNDEWIIPGEEFNFLKFFKCKNTFGHNLKGKRIEIYPDKSDINWAMVQMWPHVKPHLTVNTDKINVDDFIKNLDRDTLENYLENKITNCYIECRAAGAPPVGEEMALPALMLGLVENRKELKKITRKFKWNEWQELVFDSAVNGMDAKIRNRNILPILRELYICAFDGLEKRELGEEKYLDKIMERINTGKNPADLVIEKFKAGRKIFLEYITY